MGFSKQFRFRLWVIRISPFILMAEVEAKYYWEFSISARKLKKTDFFSKSDPHCIAKIHKLGQGWVEIGRTETIDNNLNPDFAKKIILDEDTVNDNVDLLIRFLLLDVDSPDQKLSEQDFLGTIDLNVREIIGDPAGCTRNLLDADGVSKMAGSILVSAEKIRESFEKVHIRVGANLVKESPGMFDKNCHTFYYRILRADLNIADKYIVVHQSEFREVEFPQDPLWDEAHISLATLCNGDKERDLIFQFFPLTAQCETTVAGLKYALNHSRGLLKLRSPSNKNIPWAYMKILTYDVDGEVDEEPEEEEGKK